MMASYTLSTSLSESPEKSVPFGKYPRSSPLVFSLVSLCQGRCGSAKQKVAPV